MPRHLEIYFDEAKCCVERQGNSEPYSRASRIIVRQQHGTDESAHANSHKDGPQAAHKRSESTPGQSLPDIRHKRWHHQNRRRLRRGHQQSEQTDGHGRQAKSDGAFDKAGQQKDRGNHLSSKFESTSAPFSHRTLRDAAASYNAYQRKPLFRFGEAASLPRNAVRCHTFPA